MFELLDNSRSTSHAAELHRLTEDVSMSVNGEKTNKFVAGLVLGETR